MEPNKENDNKYDNSESLNEDVFSRVPDDQEIPQDAHGGLETDEGTEEGYYSSPEDKYLAMEQTGVTYTDETNAPLLNSDHLEDGMSDKNGIWDADQKNSRNSDAFNQDEYLLDDNVDFDEDSMKSISSDDDVEDINTADEI